MNHRWPCSPFAAYTARLAEVPFLYLERCASCGALWGVEEHSARRMSVDDAESTFGVAIPVFEWAETGNPAEVVALHAQLNQGALFGLVITTVDSSWSVAERGAFLPGLPGGGGLGDGLIPVDLDAAAELADTTWGPGVAAALRLAIETNLDQGVLRVLDHIQAFFPADDTGSPWLRPPAWHSRSAAFAEILRTNGPDRDTRIRAAVDAAIAEGAVSQRDLRAAGFVP
jgi:hypothetical protein